MIGFLVPVLALATGYVGYLIGRMQCEGCRHD